MTCIHWRKAILSLALACWGCCWKKGHEKFCLVLVSILISLFFLIVPMLASPCSLASQHHLLVFVASLHKSPVLYVTRLLLFPPGAQVNQLQLIFVIPWLPKSWVQLRETWLQTYQSGAGAELWRPYSLVCSSFFHAQAIWSMGRDFVVFSSWIKPCNC